MRTKEYVVMTQIGEIIKSGDDSTIQWKKERIGTNVTAENPDDACDIVDNMFTKRAEQDQVTDKVTWRIREIIDIHKQMERDRRNQMRDAKRVFEEQQNEFPNDDDEFEDTPAN